MNIMGSTLATQPLNNAEQPATGIVPATQPPNSAEQPATGIDPATQPPNPCSYVMIYNILKHIIGLNPIELQDAITCDAF